MRLDPALACLDRPACSKKSVKGGSSGSYLAPALDLSSQFIERRNATIACRGAYIIFFFFAGEATAANEMIGGDIDIFDV